MTTKIRLLHDTVGIPTGAVAVTQSASDNTTKVATTAYVTTALANLADSAPSTLNTLNELAAALGDDANFSTTVTNSIATKLPLAGGTLTGALDVGGTITGDDGLSIQGGTGNAYLQVGSDTGSWTWKNYRSNHKLALEDSDGTGEVLNFDTSGNATFTGTISSPGLSSSSSNTGTNPAANGHIASELQFYNGSATDNNLNGIGFYNSNSAVDARIAGVHKSHSSRHGEIAFLMHDGSALTERVRFDKDGNVGIGTTAPSSILDVTVNGDKRIVLNQTGASQNSGLQFKYAGTRTWDIYNTGYAATPLYFYSQVAGASIMTLTTGGNVGIGTTSPSKSLSVKAPSGSNGGIDVFHNNGNKVAELVHSGSGDEGRLSLLDSGSTTVQFMGETGQNSYINSGNVGIGTSSPTMPLSVQAASNAYAISMHGRSDGYSELYGASNDGSTKYSFLQSHSAQTKLYTLVNAPLLFGTNSTEAYRIRTDGGLQFPDNNTFIATSNAAGGTAYEWGSIRRPASSDGGQLSLRQYSTGDTAANYPAYAGGTSGWDENTGMFFYNTDQVGFTAGGNPTLWVEDGKKHEVYESGFTSGDTNRGQRVCLGGISHVASTNPGGTGSGTYMHIKTNLPHSNIMFRFEYKGLSYDGQNMDTSIIGYTYTGVSYVHSCQIQDTGNNTYNFKQPYYSSDSKLVLVLKIANNYTGGVLWFQTVGSHAMAPGTIAIASCAYSNSTSGAF